jgi:isoaspartyl peptidase/L-asparaginase-like protein (Ntn-hydrolase superfamily)
VLVERHLSEARLAALVGEQAKQVKLLLARRIRRRVRVRGRVDPDVTQKAIERVRREFAREAGEIAIAWRGSPLASHSFTTVCRAQA